MCVSLMICVTCSRREEANLMLRGFDSITTRPRRFMSNEPIPVGRDIISSSPEKRFSAPKMRTHASLYDTKQER